MVGRRREALDAGESADIERQRTPVLPVPRSPTGLLGFLDDVLGSEVKTRRLGYLVWQVAGGIAFVLVAFAGLAYIVTYKAPIQLKTGIGLGSIVMVVSGGLGVQRWRGRRLSSGAKPSTEGRDDENPAGS